jgi:DHA1 family inner membrane transport protein
MRDAAEAEARRALRRVLILLTVASTIVVATEFIVAGLLPVLARDLQISLAKAGNLVSAFAFSAAVIGPLLTLAATRAPPRVVLAGSLLAFAGGNVVAVLAPSYGVLLGVRCVQGALLPVFISVGTAAVSALTPPERRGRALALANTGFVIGTIVAMPAGVALAADGVWWPAFLGLAFLGVIAVGLMATSFPDVSVARSGTLKQQASLLLQPLFFSHLSLSVAAFTAMFASYTYLAAWLEQVASLDGNGVAIALAGFGAAGLIGQAIATNVGDRAPLRATLLVVTTVALAGGCLSIVQDELLPLALLLGVWGAAQTAAVTLCQVRVTLAGGCSPAFAMAMNISSANLGIALGAAFGGWVVERAGVNAIGYAAPILVIVVAALARLTHTLGRFSARAAYRPGTFDREAVRPRRGAASASGAAGQRGESFQQSRAHAPSDAPQALGGGEALDAERGAIAQSHRTHFFGEVEGAPKCGVAVDPERQR